MESWAFLSPSASQPAFLGTGKVTGRDYADGVARFPDEYNQQIPSSVRLTIGQVPVVAGFQDKRVIIQNFFGFEGLNVMTGDVLDVLFIPLKCSGFHSTPGLIDRYSIDFIKQIVKRAIAS
jgi:hypothetical protein